MKPFEKLLFTFVLLIQGQLVIAATEFEDSIPLDVAEALFDISNRGQFAVYQDIVEGFPEFNLPDSFIIMGSSFINGMIQVALATRLGYEESLASIVASLTNRGWTLMPPFGPEIRDNGFVYANARHAMGSSVCHDKLGQVSFSFKEREPSNFMVLSSYQSRENRGSCPQKIAEQERNFSMMGRSRELGENMPRLEVPNPPPGGKIEPRWISGALSFSNSSVVSEGTWETDKSLEEIYRFFAKQISDQNWTLDTGSSGTLSAIGIWIRRSVNDTDLLGTLTVMKSGNEQFQLKFELVSPRPVDAPDQVGKTRL